MTKLAKWFSARCRTKNDFVLFQTVFQTTPGLKQSLIHENISKHQKLTSHLQVLSVSAQQTILVYRQSSQDVKTVASF